MGREVAPTNIQDFCLVQACSQPSFIFNCFFFGGGVYKERINSNISVSNWNPLKETVKGNHILIYIFISKRNEISLHVSVFGRC